MTEPLDSDTQDRRLWRQFSAHLGKPQGPNVDPNDLAAYLDGSADAQQIELVEARLAADPDFLQEVIQLRQMAGLEPATPSASLLAHARGFARRRAWRPRMQWAAAAAVLLACLLGYAAGTATQRTDQRTIASAEISELMADVSFASILPLNGSNGR